MKDLQFLLNLEGDLLLTLNKAFKGTKHFLNTLNKAFSNALQPNSSPPERDGDMERLKTMETNEVGETGCKRQLLLWSLHCAASLLMYLLQPQGLRH